jgi:hypothetical protein
LKRVKTRSSCSICQAKSPELNPEERLNADLKQALYTKVPVRTKAKLKTVATEHMQALDKSPERVRKFFQDACVEYAA